MFVAPAVIMLQRACLAGDSSHGPGLLGGGRTNRRAARNGGLRWVGQFLGGVAVCMAGLTPTVVAGAEVGPESEWCAAANALAAGEELILRPGEYLGPCAIRRGGTAEAPIVMVDCAEHLDLIESVLGTGAAPVRVCIELDASWWALGGRVKIGAKRSPIHDRLAARIRHQQEILPAGTILVHHGHGIEVSRADLLHLRILGHLLHGPLMLPLNLRRTIRTARHRVFHDGLALELFRPLRSGMPHGGLMDRSMALMGRVFSRADQRERQKGACRQQADPTTKRLNLMVMIKHGPASLLC